MGDSKPCLYILRKSRATEVIAMALDGKPDHLARMNIEHPLVDQETIDNRIEVAVILNIVNVTVYVIVHPARRNSQEVKILVALSRWLFFHGFFLV
jgi:hypothetical protein